MKNEEAVASLPGLGCSLRLVESKFVVFMGLLWSKEEDRAVATVPSFYLNLDFQSKLV